VVGIGSGAGMDFAITSSTFSIGTDDFLVGNVELLSAANADRVSFSLLTGAATP
jgi:hypothetical protein